MFKERRKYIVFQGSERTHLRLKKKKNVKLYHGCVIFLRCVQLVFSCMGAGTEYKRVGFDQD